ncbi:hypothetical protein G6F57_020921 [Rhizopus arrhizus]|nr:hypothetical protein G6F57_020921 [Rhizopus arrhizus]
MGARTGLPVRALARLAPGRGRLRPDASRGIGYRGADPGVRGRPARRRPRPGLPGPRTGDVRARNGQLCGLDHRPRAARELGPVRRFADHDGPAPGRRVALCRRDLCGDDGVRVELGLR